MQAKCNELKAEPSNGPTRKTNPIEQSEYYASSDKYPKISGNMKYWQMSGTLDTQGKGTVKLKLNYKGWGKRQRQEVKQFDIQEEWNLQNKTGINSSCVKERCNATLLWSFKKCFWGLPSVGGRVDNDCLFIFFFFFDALLMKKKTCP